MADLVVIFDFDKTIIDVDSDNWVVDELGATDLFDRLLPTMPWNILVNRMMEELLLLGKTIDDIVEVLKRAPIHPRIVQAVKSAHALGCDLRIVSDANVVFIDTILKNAGLKECFSLIYTNPSYVDKEEGRLRIFPFHDFLSSPHGCKLCPPNMCKGQIIEKIQSTLVMEGKKKKKIIYLGDGAGDFCPSLRLKEGDHMMPRKNYPVWDLICENRHKINAEIHEWVDGEELEQILIPLINTISIEDEHNAFSSVDYKFETGPASVSVPH